MSIPRRNFLRNFKKAVLEPDYAIKAFYKRLKSYLSYKFSDGGKSAFPESITLFLTYRCNMRCSMCGQWGSAGATRQYSNEKLKEELDFPILEKFLDEVSSFSPHITLFGGEPLLYKNMIELLRKIKSLNLHSCIITNGYLIEDIAEELVDLKLDELSVSIDGPFLLHDEIRGVKQSFEKIARGIKKINSLKKIKNQRKPIINIVSTISNLNFDRLHEMVYVAEDLEADTLNFHHLIFIDENTFNEHNKIFNSLFGKSSIDWHGFILEDKKNIDVAILLKEIAVIKTKSSKVSINFYPNFTLEEIREYYLNPDFLPVNYKNRCLSPWMVAYIYPNGDVSPCLTLGYVAGNIKENSFRQIWNNEKYVRFRKIVKEIDFFPVCPRCTEFYRY